MMKKRICPAVSLRTVQAVLWGSLCCCVLMLASPAFAADTPYKVVNPPQTPQVEPGQIEVIEFFWYGCSHCYAFESYLGQWLESKPADVVFKRIPAPINEQWAIHAQAFYAAEALGGIEKMHKGFFKAIHQEKITLIKEAELSQFFGRYGYSSSRFVEVYHSDAVRKKLRGALGLARGYRISAVPTVIVNGKYAVSSHTVNGGAEEILSTVDALIEKERRMIKRQSSPTE